MKTKLLLTTFSLLLFACGNSELQLSGITENQWDALTPEEQQALSQSFTEGEATPKPTEIFGVTEEKWQAMTNDERSAAIKAFQTQPQDPQKPLNHVPEKIKISITGGMASFSKEGSFDGFKPITFNLANTESKTVILDNVAKGSSRKSPLTVKLQDGVLYIDDPDASSFGLKKNLIKGQTFQGVSTLGSASLRNATVTVSKDF